MLRRNLVLTIKNPPLVCQGFIQVGSTRPTQGPRHHSRFFVNFQGTGDPKITNLYLPLAGILGPGGIDPSHSCASMWFPWMPLVITAAAAASSCTGDLEAPMVFWRRREIHEGKIITVSQFGHSWLGGLPGVCCNFLGEGDEETPLPEHSLWKLVVRRQGFPFGMARQSMCYQPESGNSCGKGPF